MSFFRASWSYLLTRMPLPNHHPLYSLLAKACIMVLGEKEWTARLPAFLCGSLTPPLLYLVGSKWVSERAGLLAGLFLCVSPEAVWYAQDARGYAGAIFFSLAATHLFLVLNLKITPGRAALYILASAAAVYSHLYTGAVLAAHLAIASFLAVKDRGDKKRLTLVSIALGGLALCLLLYAPFAHDLASYTRTVGKKTTGRALDFEFLVDLILGWSAGGSHPWLSLPLVIAALVGAWMFAKKSATLFAAYSLALVLALLIPAVLGTFVYARFYTFALPGFYLALACAPDAVLPRLKAPARAAPVTAALLLAILASGLVPYYRFGKQGLSPAAQWVRTNAPGRRALAAGMIGEVLYYYMPAVSALPRDLKLTRDLLDRSVVVTSYETTVGEDNQKAIQEFCRLAQVFPSAGDPQLEVKVYLCGAPP